MTTLDRTSKLPLYQQLYDTLRFGLLRGQWHPGDLLPTETELMERYGLSRIGVRQALDMLVKDGLIYRQRGRGTFAAHPPIQQVLTHIVSFTDDMTRRGFRPGTEVLTAELMPAPDPTAAALRVPPCTELAHIQRLRLADGEPMAIEDSYLVHHYCPGILAHDFATRPLRETLEGAYGLRMARARQTIRAQQAGRELAATLGVKHTAALLLIERVSYSEQDVPVEFLRIYYRGDRYSLSGELQG